MSHHQRASVLLSGIAAFAATAPSFALAASEGGDTLPQFDVSTFATQLFWLAISLVIFFFIMRNNALPKIEDALETRRRKVDDDLDKASAHREEAEAAMAAYEKALATAVEQAKAIHREVAQEIAESATAHRTANLQDVAIEVVQEVAAKLAGLKVSGADAKAAVTATLKEKT
jgi:F-type H+-transporting ATPase subunit b